MSVRDRIAEYGRRVAGFLESGADRIAPGAGAEPAPPGFGPPSPAPATADGFDADGYPSALAITKALREAVSDGSLAGPSQNALTDSIGAANGTPKGLYSDPYALVQQLGFRDKPSAVTYSTLNAMVWRVPIVQAIIQTRITQVSSFASPQHYKFETGFRVRMRDAEAHPSPADKRFMKNMEEMILSSGVTHDGRERDSFEVFLRKICRDSLIYDQTNVEVVPGRDGRPACWYAVDASTIRLADTSKLYPEEDPEKIHSVQVYDNIIIAEFNRNEMAFEVRNPRSDIRSFGYGTSELEMLVGTITAVLWAWHYNQNFFSQGSVAKGLLNLVGSIPEKQLRAFRRQWYQMVSGVENAWRTPITNAEKVEWINMHPSNRDMEFSAWMDFLIKVVCSVYQMDPVEINFKYGNQAQRSMFEGASKAKSQESKERGLRPLLRHIGRLIDKYIIWPINPDFTFEFVGLESQTPKELADLMTQRVRTIYTINEIRAESDLGPLPDGLGDVILDANWINVRSQLIQQRQKEADEAKAEAKEAKQLAMQAMGQGGSVNLDGLQGAVQSQLGAGAPKPAKTPPPSGKPPKPGPGQTKGVSIPAQTEKELSNEMAASMTARPIKMEFEL